MAIPENKFSCVENDNTHLWIDNEDNEPSIHVLGPWENGLRKELVVCFNEEQLEEFKRQVAAL